MIKPGSSPISYSGTGGSGTIYVDEVQKTVTKSDFDRLEFSNRKLREAPTITGSTPLIVQGFGNQPIQLLTTCTDDTARPLGPDDSNISNIKKRFIITRYTIKGGCNTYTDVENLRAQLANDLVILDGFDLYLGELSMELSITYLTTVLQPLTFSNLTSTSLSLTGNVLHGTVSNLLLTELTWDAEYEAPISGSLGSSDTLYSFTSTFESRSYGSQGPLPS